MNEEPCFEIFSGSFDDDAMWIETVSGLERAREQMHELAGQSPGRYFLFSFRARKIVAIIDSRSKLIRAERINHAAVA